MKLLQIISLSCVSVFAFPMLASSSTIATEIASTTVDTFDLFDSALGTLEEVSYSVFLDVAVRYKAIGITGCDPRSFNCDERAFGVDTFASLGVTSNGFSAFDFTSSRSEYCSAIEVGSRCSIEAKDGFGTEFDKALFPRDAEFETFLGVGTFDVTWQLSSGLSIFIGDGLRSSIELFPTGRLELEYTYTTASLETKSIRQSSDGAANLSSVPIPATALLLLGGKGALVISARKRKPAIR